MIRELGDDPTRDSRLAEALRRGEQRPVPHEDEALRARILQAAAPRLARLREQPRAWWEWTAVWARVLLPVGMAASLAAGVLLVQYGTSIDSTATEVAPLTARSLVFGLATGATTAPEIADELVAQPTDDWLLTQAMNR